MKDENRRDLPFLVIVPAKAMIPARRSASHARLVPSFVTWYDRNADSFRDPVPDLSEGDRLLMSKWITSVLDSLPEYTDENLKNFLLSFFEDICSSGASDIPDPFLEIRLNAVNGLRNLPAYRSSLTRNACVYESGFGNDPIASVCSGVPCSPVSCVGLPEQVTYEWRGNPFARENSKMISGSADPGNNCHALPFS